MANKKKSVLFVIPSLNTGGAEKSLHGLLKYWDFEKYSVDVLLFAQNGELAQTIDKRVQVFSDNALYQSMFYQSVSRSCKSLIRAGRIDLAFWRIIWGLLPLMHRLLHKPYYRNTALDWKIPKKVIQRIYKHYDVAIGYMEGASNYIVLDLIDADKKIGWIHTDYSMVHPNVKLDRKKLSGLDRVVTVSMNSSRQILSRIPELQDKLCVIPNIIDTAKIDALKNEAAPELEGIDKPILVSVGRLVALKGFDICIKAAKLLKETGVAFLWIIVGEGEEHLALQALIDSLGVGDMVKLIGERLNPYCYIAKSTLCVQMSKYEGRSLVIDEEQYLKKPMVVSNVPSYTEMVVSGETGLVVERTPEDLVRGIQRLLSDTHLRKKIESNLESKIVNDTMIVEKVKKLIDESIE